MKNVPSLITAVALFYSASVGVVRGEEEAVSGSICTSLTNTFTVKLNLYASEFGYFTFEECGDVIMPTIGLEIGQIYTFNQAHHTNYYHPLGFGYAPYEPGKNNNPELEPGLAGPGNSDTSCEATRTCPAPMYYQGGEYLGSYSNIPEIQNVTVGEVDFGLDAYEPLFGYPLLDWLNFGEFSIKLRFTEETYSQDLFYFCHIHGVMSGRIKLLKDGVPINPGSDEPPLGFEYYQPSEFDQQCGTWDLDRFQLPNSQCPAAFVCGADETADPVTQAYAVCTDAMDCHMFAGMTTGISAQSEAALFVHQMIPHHQNAVNMAKTLLKTGLLQCDDLTQDTTKCIMQRLMYDFINNQNHQVQQMRDYNEAKGYPATDDCVIEVESQVAGTASDVITDTVEEEGSSSPVANDAGDATGDERDPSQTVVASSSQDASAQRARTRELVTMLTTTLAAMIL